MAANWEIGDRGTSNGGRYYKLVVEKALVRPYLFSTMYTKKKNAALDCYISSLNIAKFVYRKESSSFKNQGAQDAKPLHHYVNFICNMQVSSLVQFSFIEVLPKLYEEKDRESEAISELLRGNLHFLKTRYEEYFIKNFIFISVLNNTDLKTM